MIHFSKEKLRLINCMEESFHRETFRLSFCPSERKIEYNCWSIIDFVKFHVIRANIYRTKFRKKKHTFLLKHTYLPYPLRAREDIRQEIDH